jgi:hypothetical protein
VTQRPQETIASEPSSVAPRIYSIQPDQGYFEAGVTGGERQVLMGLYCPALVAIFFDAAGDLVSYEARHLEFLQASNVIVDGEPIEGLVRRYNIYDERILLNTSARFSTIRAQQTARRQIFETRCSVGMSTDSLYCTGVTITG